MTPLRLLESWAHRAEACGMMLIKRTMVRRATMATVLSGALLLCQLIIIVSLHGPIRHRGK